MSKKLLLSVATAALLAPVTSFAAPLNLMSAPVEQVEAQPATEPQIQLAATRGAMGGGFIEFLFNGGQDSGRAAYAPQYAPQAAPQAPRYGEPAYPAVDPKYDKQEVAYSGNEAPGTIVIDTPNRFLYLVQGGGRALRYGIGVGKPGFSWAGVKTVSNKREWPDWTPPAEMLKRRPDLPRHMEGGPDNPLGARAMYLGSSLYRIHGSNEPWTIGTAVSSGCIRMRNEDVTDLYERVRVGTRVIVM
jgi:lipoprotein-anchoring transpeptidase ErfK/SrfK